MAISLTVPEGYGYSVIVALGLIPILSQAQGMVVTSSRKKAKVPYPNPYASAEAAKENPAVYKFNCAQRAHQNLLENTHQTAAQLLFTGLFYPRAAPILGAAWVFFRILYAYGYITSREPNGRGRQIGGGCWLVQIGLICLTISSALQLI